MLKFIMLIFKFQIDLTTLMSLLSKIMYFININYIDSNDCYNAINKVSKYVWLNTYMVIILRLLSGSHGKN